MNKFLNDSGVKYPIIQAPMGWIARSQLASAVSNAGLENYQTEKG